MTVAAELSRKGSAALIGYGTITIAAKIDILGENVVSGKIIVNFPEIFNRFNILKLLPVRGGVSAEIIDFDFSCAAEPTPLRLGYV